MGEEILLAAELHHDLARRRAGEQCRYDLEVQHLDARPEAAAHERLDYPDARGVHIKAACEHEVQVVGDLRHALHRQALRERFIFGERCVRLDLRMVDFRAADAVLAHKVGPREARRNIAEGMMDFAFEVARLVVMKQHCVRRTRRGGAVIGRKLTHLEYDELEGTLCGHGVDGGNRGDRFATVPHAPARKRVFIHGDRQHTIGVKTVIAGQHRENAVECTGLCNVEPDNLAVAHRTAKDAPDQRIGMGEIGRIGGAAGHFLHAVDQRNTAPRHARPGGRGRRHDAVSAAAWTNSMIFT